MSTATLLRRLGYQDTDRLVILHADDVGMCQATLTAFDDLWQCGGVTCGAVMAPCPWFPALSAYCRENPDVDMGVHATLNCEWAPYRWGALSPRGPQSGLLDTDGYLHNTVAAVLAHATPEEVSNELKAQINTTLQAGIDITHIDSHMGTILTPNYFQDYIQQGIANRVPSMLPRTTAVGVESMGATDEQLQSLGPVLDQLESQGYPLIDGIMMMPLDQPEGQLEIAKRMLSQLPVGVTHFIFHPAMDTPEIRAICPDWPSRVANYHTFMNPEIQSFLKQENIHPIGYRALRDAMRG